MNLQTMNTEEYKNVLVGDGLADEVNEVTARADAEVVREIESEVGPFADLSVMGDGSNRLMGLNDIALARYYYYCERGGLVLNKGEADYFRFNGRFWEPLSRVKIWEILRVFFQGVGKGRGWVAVHRRLTLAWLRGAETYLSAVAERGGFFERSPRSERFPVVFRNGTVVVSEDGVVWEPAVFRRADRVRNLIDVDFEEGVECPEFIKGIRGMFDEKSCDADVEVYLLALGQCLIGFNLRSLVLILEGEANSGKSSLLKIVQLLLGKANVANLRTKYLGDRFELIDCIAKLALMVADASEGTLHYDGADVVKALVGGDVLTAEAKQGNDRVNLVGYYPVLISTNCDLRVRDQGDADAWRRRLVRIPCCIPAGRKEERFWAEKIIEKEGAGIVYQSLQRVAKFLVDPRAFDLSPVQADRVEALLNLSSPLISFIAENIGVAEGGQVLRSEFKERYGSYLRDHGHTLPAHWVAAVAKYLTKNFGVKESGSVGAERKAKGWRGIAWID